MLILPAGGPRAYPIDRSVRFRTEATNYFTKTWGSNGNRRTMTFSFWCKRAVSNTLSLLISAGDVRNNAVAFGDNSYAAGAAGTPPLGSLLFLYNTVASNTYLYSTGVDLFLDTTAWYHVVVAIDTTQATAANRVKAYVNNKQLTLTGNQVAQNTDLDFFSTVSAMQISSSASGPLNGYMAHCYAINGQQLTPAAFAVTDSHGAQYPKDYTAAFGAFDVRLDFSDFSGTTSSTLGKDSSGNNNDFTPGNFSVTLGVDYGSSVDTPTPYGADTGPGETVRGNYCTWNAIWPGAGGLTKAALSVTNNTARGTQPLLYYDAYWEIAAAGGTVTAGAVSRAGTTNTTTIADGKTYGFRLSAAGALDYINITDAGSWTSITTGLSGEQYIYATCGSGVTAHLNCGQRAFTGSLPSGFKSVCSRNLTDVVVALGATFTGNASTDGPYLWANGIITAITINGNAATEGTHFRRLAGGLKIITSSASYNASGSNTITTYTAGTPFKYARAG